MLKLHCYKTSCCASGAALKSLSAAAILSERDLLFLLGHLIFSMCIIPHDRSLVLRWLTGCRSHLQFWSLYVRSIPFFNNDFVKSSNSLKFFTDAAPSVDFGEFYDNEWFADVWNWNSVLLTTISTPLLFISFKQSLLLASLTIHFVTALLQ